MSVGTTEDQYSHCGQLLKLLNDFYQRFDVTAFINTIQDDVCMVKSAQAFVKKINQFGLRKDGLAKRLTPFIEGGKEFFGYILSVAVSLNELG
jgi:hypothetical protein